MLCIVQERGQGLVEYAFILLLIALIVFAILAIFGSSIGNVFTRMNSSLPTY
ncbi:MAG: pilus assembly protein [Anaerolineales bacterium]